MKTPSTYYEKAKLAGTLSLFFHFMAVIFLIGNAPTVFKFLFYSNSPIAGSAALLAALLLFVGVWICFRLGFLFGSWKRRFLDKARKLENKMASILAKFPRD